MKIQVVWMMIWGFGCQESYFIGTSGEQDEATSFYIDAEHGSDDNSGTRDQPWQTLDVVSDTVFQPGERVYFKRGTSYQGCVTIHGDGTEQSPIIVGAYGEGAAPRFSNPTTEDHSGNAMRIRGAYQIVENLYFHHTAPAIPQEAGFEEVWQTGAIHISLGSDHATIQNNEFASVPKGIQSYSEYSLITENYIHDGNEEQQNGFLSEPYWGPIGIQLGIGNQEVSYNIIENMVVEGGEYGADGGAIEIDDGRHHKNNIHIHHNTTVHNMGFVEISYWDDIEFMDSNSITIEHNISRDYQTFVLWWAPTQNSIIQNNTIIRDDNEVEGNWSTVFIVDEPPSEIAFRKNIVVIDDDQTHAIFAEGFNGGINDITHTENCYWNAEGGGINLGLSSYGFGEIESNPMFVGYQQQDYSVQNNSPALGWGALAY